MSFWQFAALGIIAAFIIECYLVDRRLQQPRKVVRWFSGLMERKLRLNEHKGGWEKDTFPELLARLHEEVEELEEAVYSGKEGNIELESADVANFAMMIADKANGQPIGRDER